MTYRKFFSALLLAAALLCACAQREPAGEENPAGTPAPPAEQALLWGGLDWRCRRMVRSRRSCRRM